MSLLKSVAAGVFGTLIAAVAVSGVITVLAWTSHDLPDGRWVDWDPISFMRHSAIAWVALSGGFALGFVHQIRRAH